MTQHIVYVGDKDCPVCEKLSENDEQIAKEAGYELSRWELDVLAQTPGTLRDYVVSYHVDEEGMIQLPTYVIVEDVNGLPRIKASIVGKEDRDVGDLIKAWEAYQANEGQREDT